MVLETKVQKETLHSRETDEKILTHPLITVVIPVFGSSESLPELFERLERSLGAITPNYEVILVNDASPDDSWSRIMSQAQRDKRFIGIELSRNFGQHAAIMRGLVYSSGEWVIVMDCDLQDEPEEIPNLLNKSLEGFDQVVGVRVVRKDRFRKRLTSRLYIAVLSSLMGVRLNPGVGNFGIYHRKVVHAICLNQESAANFGILALWVGFRRAELPVNHAPRKHGASTYRIRSLLRHGLMSIIYNSEKPLRFSVAIGFLVSFFSFIASFVIAVRAIFFETPVGWASLIVFLGFSTGVVLSAVGVVGLYVGRILIEVRRRPNSIVASTTTD